ncbi:MAG: hypothetical protein H6Q57_2256 [Geobacteraceae bacterium]|nr:hypothetical protein [Geobacteraceae bacterium]
MPRKSDDCILGEIFAGAERHFIVKRLNVAALRTDPGRDPCNSASRDHSPPVFHRQFVILPSLTGRKLLQLIHDIVQTERLSPGYLYILTIFLQHRLERFVVVAQFHAESSL